MNQKSEQGLYEVLEAELRASDEPLDCVTLFERSSVRQHAASANRVSDYLGNMWRKGLVLRVPAPRMDGTKSRWMYVWKDKGPKRKPKPDLSQAIAYDESVATLLSRPNIEIAEDGSQVTITLPDWTISIKKRAN